jgi:hypothetical protein
MYEKQGRMWQICLKRYCFAELLQSARLGFSVEGQSDVMILIRRRKVVTGTKIELH